MNVFFREIRANRKSLIIWCIAVFLMVASGMAKFAGLSASEQSINDLMSQVPQSLKAIFGMGTFNLSLASGYYGMLFLYLALMATIHSSILGANIISKEERDKTADFLFVKPVSRSFIITSKLLAGLVNIVIFNIVTLLSSLVIVGKYSKGEDVSADIVMLMIALFLLQLIFLFVGTAIAAVCKNPKTAISLSTAILLITYILSVGIDINSSLEILKYLTPFKYYDAKNLMYGGGIDTFYLLLSAVIVTLLFITTYLSYNKRDLI